MKKIIWVVALFLILCSGAALANLDLSLDLFLGSSVPRGAPGEYLFFGTTLLTMGTDPVTFGNSSGLFLGTELLTFGAEPLTF